MLATRLPGIRQALAEGRLRLRTLPLSAPADSDWAHDRWLRGHPALGASSVPAGAVAAVRAFATAQASVPTGRSPAAPTAPQTSADAPSTTAMPGWLLQPVTFRLTTDGMMLDPTPQRAVDAAMAERMIQAIAPLLADEGLEIEMQTPARWLLHPRTGTAGWQLACTPIEAVGESHIDVLMPQGPDAKRFLRLLNEVQMSWNLLTLNEPQDLPVNAIWPSGPAHSPAIDAMRDLLARGLVVDERFLMARLTQDLSAWLDALPALDAWFSDDPAGFACLLADLEWTEERARTDFAAFLDTLHAHLHELAETIQPVGLHTFGQNAQEEHRLATVMMMLGKPFLEAAARHMGEPQTELDETLAVDYQQMIDTSPYRLLKRYLQPDADLHELPEPLQAQLTQARQWWQALDAGGETGGLIAALQGRYRPTAYGGDPVRNPDALPTGRNLYGFDPSRVPTRHAWEAGKQAAEKLIAAHRQQHGRTPAKLAVSLWSVETMRHQGLLEAQALWLMGVEPIWDEGGRVIDVKLVPREQLGRPRVDVVLSATGLYSIRVHSMMERID